MNCIQTLQPDTLSPFKPVNLKIRHVNKSTVVNWSEHTRNKTFIGYNIYINGKRTWYTPLTSFTIPGIDKGKILKIKAIDLHGNESKFSALVML
jgi:hypothetical protein